MELTCPRCKATNQYANERCTECGSILQPGSRTITCPTCRVTVGRSTAYCPNCGQPLNRKGATARSLPQIPGLGHLKGGRQCSKCGTLRNASLPVCPECGTRRSRIADPAVVSFSDLAPAQRQALAGALQSAAEEGLTLRQAAARLFGPTGAGHPYFREFPQFYELLCELQG